MTQPRSTTLTIPEPCTVPWNTMNEVDDVRRHCESCATVVTDFSGMTDDELVAFLHHRKGQKSCGRFHSSQLNRPLVLLPAHTRKAVWWKAAVLLPFSLFSKNSQAQQQDSVAVAADSVVAVIDTVTVADTTAIAVTTDSLVPVQDNAITKTEHIIPTALFPFNDDTLEMSVINGQFTVGYMPTLSEEEKLRLRLDSIAQYINERALKTASWLRISKSKKETELTKGQRFPSEKQQALLPDPTQTASLFSRKRKKN